MNKEKDFYIRRLSNFGPRIKIGRGNVELISRYIKYIEIVVLLLVMVWVTVFANVNRTYSASEVLGDYADLKERY